MRAILVGLTLAFAAACSGNRARTGYDPGGVRLCVDNAAAGYGNIVVDAGGIRFRVYPGDEVCRTVRAVAGGLPIRATSTAGGMAGPLRFAFQLPIGESCWYWRVSGPASGLDIVPCP